jgi:DNA-binding transcriptional MerR regulator
MTDYLTTAEVAKRYRTDPSTVRYWRMKGYGPKGVRCGKRVLYPLDAIEAFDRELAGQVREA